MSKISKDTPLAEITLRRYEKPGELEERELVRKICLSLGVLQPGDSRDIIVDLLLVMIKENRKKNLLGSDEIEKKVIEERKARKLPATGTAPSNIRRQLRRLKDIFLIDKDKGKYRISEFSPLKEVFEDKIMKYFVASISERICEYCDALDKG